MKIKTSICMMTIIFILFLNSPSQAVNTVESIGTGTTRQMAINNAIRAAIEQAAGVLINSLTEVKNNELMLDKVTAASAGYVKAYDIITEGRDPVDNTYKVKIRASIDDIKLKGALEEFLKDPRAQRTFQETKFNERRVIVLYQPRTNLDLPLNSKAMQKVMDLIQDRLTGYGFKVFLPEELSRITGKALEMVTDEATALTIAKQEKGDALVVVNFDAGKAQTDEGLNIIMSELFLKAYDPTTLELFANVSKKAKTISQSGDYGIEDAIAATTEKSGREAVELLAKKIVERFSTNRANFTAVIFKNILLSDQQKVEDMLESLNWKYKVVKQTGEYIEIEIFSEGDPNSVKRTILKKASGSGIIISGAELSGSKIIFYVKK